MLYITGDTHTPIDVHKLGMKYFPQQRFMVRENDYLIICGDFGAVWDNSKEEHYWRKWLDNKPFTVLFVDGNHENFDLLNEFPIIDKFGGQVQQIGENIFHLLRGEIYKICGKEIFCFGGASSHDKHLRVPYKSWWPNELPTMEEMQHGIQMLDNHKWNVDYIITHCASKSVQAEIAYWYENDSLTSFFQFIKENCLYRHWYFGHYHIDKRMDEKHTALYQKIVSIP